MQVSVETVSNIERKITIGVPAGRIEGEITKRLQNAAQTVRIDGFRPGKVPVKVVKKRFGVGIRQEVLNEVMRESLMEALQQEEINPVGTPNIETKTAEEGKDLEYVATVEIFPEISLGDLSSVTIEKPKASIAEGDIDQMIEQLQQQKVEMTPVTRAAQDKDEVTIDFAGTLEGEAFEGGAGQDHKLILGSNSMIEGFESGLIGVSADEEKTLALTFPAEYHAEHLAGKDVEFVVTVKAVSEPKLPELNEDFFTQFGVKEGGEEAFRKSVSENMQRELDKAIREKVKNSVIDSLIESNPLEIPSALIDQEVQRLRQEMVQQFGGGQQFDASQLPAELFTDQAKKRVTSGLLINQYIQDRELELDDAAMDEHLERFAASYEDPAEVIDYIKQDQNQLDHFKSLALEEKVIDTIITEISVKEVEVSYEDALKPAAPPADATDDGKTDGSLESKDDQEPKDA